MKDTHTHTLVLFMSYRGYRTLTVKPKRITIFRFLPKSIFYYYFAGGGRGGGCYTVHSPLSLSLCLLSTPSLSLSFLIFLRLSLSLSLQIVKTTSSSLCEKRHKKRLLLLFTSLESTTRLFCAFIFSFSAMLKKFPFWELSLSLLLCFALLSSSSTSLADSDSDPDSDRLDLDHSNSSESNVSLSKPKEGSFAHMIDQALANEFPENDQPEGPLRSNLSLSLANSNYFRNFQKKKFWISCWQWLILEASTTV